MAVRERSEEAAEFGADADVALPDNADNAEKTGKRRLPRFTPRKSRKAPVLPEQNEDAWLDSLEEAPQRTGFSGFRDKIYDSFGGTGRWVVEAWGFLLTTLGRLIAMMVALTLLLLGTGYLMSQSSANRESALDGMLTATEPMSNSAHILYTSLSQADTLATTSFVQPGLQDAESHREYMAAIDEAVIAADDVLRGSVETRVDDSTEVQNHVREIQRLLPQYTGLMERAQANQRTGNPLGVAYMTQASTMMREEMLVSAEEILQLTRAQLGGEMKRLSTPQFGPLSGLLIAVLALLAAQCALWRMFRRRLNRGFLVATAFLLIAVVWVGVSNIAAWHAGTREFEAAAGPFEQLTGARISAQETRTNETLTLLTRRSSEGSPMAATVEEVRDALDAIENEDNAGEVDTARTALSEWRLAHTRMMNALQSGDYERAVDIAASTSDEESAASAFSLLDDSLTDLISSSREDLREDINDGLSASRSVAPGVMLLVFAAVIAMWFGIRPRMQEYM